MVGFGVGNATDADDEGAGVLGADRGVPPDVQAVRASRKTSARGQIMARCTPGRVAALSASHPTRQRTEGARADRR